LTSDARPSFHGGPRRGGVRSAPIDPRPAPRRGRRSARGHRPMPVISTTLRSSDARSSVVPRRRTPLVAGVRGKRPVDRLAQLPVNEDFALGARSSPDARHQHDVASVGCALVSSAAADTPVAGGRHPVDRLARLPVRDFGARRAVTPRCPASARRCERRARSSAVPRRTLLVGAGTLSTRRPLAQLPRDFGSRASSPR
jgi:hypothetical protein